MEVWQIHEVASVHEPANVLGNKAQVELLSVGSHVMATLGVQHSPEMTASSLLLQREMCSHVHSLQVDWYVHLLVLATLLRTVLRQMVCQALSIHHTVRRRTIILQVLDILVAQRSDLNSNPLAQMNPLVVHLCGLAQT